VCIRANWARKFYNNADYLGRTLNIGDGKEHFPGFGLDASKLLVKRNVAGLGIDTASIDVGKSGDYPVHTYFLRTERYQIENMKLDGLPNSGFTFVTLPLPIEKAPECETRVLAIIPESAEPKVYNSGEL
jgi:kynurenine formamidase